LKNQQTEKYLFIYFEVKISNGENKKSVQYLSNASRKKVSSLRGSKQT